MFLLQKCTDIGQNLLAQKIKGLLRSSCGYMGADHSRMLQKRSGNIPQRSLRITDKIVVPLIQPPCQSRYFMSRTDGRIKEQLPLSQGRELFLVKQNHIFIKAQEYRLTVCQKLMKRLIAKSLSFSFRLAASAEIRYFRSHKPESISDHASRNAQTYDAYPWEVRFIELMPMGPCAGWEKSCFLSVDEVLRGNPALQKIEDRGVARRYRLPDAMGTVGLISPLSHDFCGDCRRIRVTSDGRLKGCLHSAAEIPLRGLHGIALEEAIRRGILQKPLRHHLAEHPSDTPRNMNQIGG